MTYRLQPHHAPRFRIEHRESDSSVSTLPIEGYRQTRGYTCGYATSLMIARYFGAQRAGEELYRRLGTSGEGTSQAAIVRELRAAGVRANIRYDVGLDRIAREIDRGKLLVGYLFDVEHWLVIYGYGRRPDRVFVADPRPQQECEHLWEGYGERLGNFGIVCSSAQPVSRPAQPASRPAKRVERGPLLLGPSPLAARDARPDSAQLALPFAAGS